MKTREEINARYRRARAERIKQMEENGTIEDYKRRQAAIRKKSRQKNLSTVKLRKKLWDDKNTDHKKSYYQRWGDAGGRAHIAERRKKVKQEVIDHYGGACKVCNESRLEFLCLDHINGDGAEHRRNVGIRCGKETYEWVKKNAFPEIFQVLCHNHSFKKEREAWRSNHKRPKEALRKQRLKLKVLGAYGAYCACCGEKDADMLQLDHINGDGAEHRRTIGCGTGYATYAWAKRNGFPPTLRVLCASCNFSVHVGRGVCAHTRLVLQE